ncbi:hypothetical protein GEV43_26395 [Actinomadura sp. J1-007]|nr:hypothetical protein [Actinomadura sp. J1-007]
MWVLGAVGWGVVLAGLRRGVHGLARAPALFAHALTPAGAVLACSVAGFGFLYATIALTAEWWALALVTGFRPERLLEPDPRRAGGADLRRLAAWAALTAAATAAAGALIL